MEDYFLEFTLPLEHGNLTAAYDKARYILYPEVLWQSLGTTILIRLYSMCIHMP